MRTIVAFFVLSAAGSAWASAGASPEVVGLQAPAAPAAPRPHLLLVLGDDLGFYDTRAEPMSDSPVIFMQIAFDVESDAALARRRNLQSKLPNATPEELGRTGCATGQALCVHWTSVLRHVSVAC
jgi:hypothetical protein